MKLARLWKLYDNIADQTKLIAFNAAIEASSAGEAGKRFWVVSVGIRQLADNVMDSTGKIKVRLMRLSRRLIGW